jgi:TRAP transporter TAXI family solute receptor
MSIYLSAKRKSNLSFEGGSNMKSQRCNMKKTSLCLIFIILMAFCGSANAAKQMTISTGSIGGAYYPVGTGIASIVSKSDAGIRLTAEVSGGALENCRLIDKNYSDFAITNADIVYFAHTGTVRFKKKMNVVAIGALHESTFQVVTLQKTGIKTVKDLKGRPVSMAQVGSGSENCMGVVLRAHGMTINDVVRNHMNHSAAADALKDGRIDAMAILAGRPTGALVELRTARKFQIVKIEPAILDKLVNKYPYYVKSTVPAATYKLDDDYDTLSVRNIFITNPSTDAEYVYKVTKVLYENLEKLLHFHRAASQISLKKAPQVPVPLHPGAIKYYKERGLIK